MDQTAAILLDKSQRSLEAAELLLAAGHSDFAASRAYYAMLYAADALLSAHGQRFHDHAGSHAGFAERFVRTGLIDARHHAHLVRGYETRITAEYGADGPFPADQAARLIHEAREFLEAVRACWNATCP